MRSLLGWKGGAVDGEGERKTGRSVGVELGEVLLLGVVEEELLLCLDCLHSMEDAGSFVEGVLTLGEIGRVW